jgi:hypothetical protein
MTQPVQGLTTEIFLTRSAILAFVTGPSQPGDTYTLILGETLNALSTGHDPAHDLVSEHNGQFGLGEVTIDHMQIGPTDPAGHDPDQHLSWSRLWSGTLRLDQCGARSLQYHGMHSTYSGKRII